MWNSFQDALERRVRDGERKQVVADKYIIMKVTHQVLKDIFGAAGKENIEVSLSEQKKLMLRCTKSIWRSELLLHLMEIKKRILAQIGKESVKEIIVIQ